MENYEQCDEWSWPQVNQVLDHEDKVVEQNEDYDAHKMRVD